MEHSKQVVDAFAEEIRQALEDFRAVARPGRKGEGPEDHVAHERRIVFDAVLAVMIRHRLPINAEHAYEHIKQAQSASGLDDRGRADASRWAYRCAEYAASSGYLVAALPVENTVVHAEI